MRDPYFLLPLRDRWRSIVLACWRAAPTVILTACATPYDSHTNPTDCDIRIGGAVLSVAADNGFAYRQAVLSACSGNAGALVDLLLFTDKTDGEATLDHGSVLLALRDHVGRMGNGEWEIG